MAAEVAALREEMAALGDLPVLQAQLGRVATEMQEMLAEVSLCCVGPS